MFSPVFWGNFKQFIGIDFTEEEINSIAKGYSKFYLIIRDCMGVTTLKRRPKAIVRYLTRKGKIYFLQIVLP